ncbi:hypothetical protein BDV29DRAFT_98604 [Aspergillus leporis]|uniref:Uncharacterized protein n=1 Tax=Aspergillus leporis TaxID=41062 RepID=A0A5N5X785_9EURO|nr:hypothetical protein BDV29DRAFT_98604 [Aspergillus leporis]
MRKWICPRRLVLLRRGFLDVLIESWLDYPPEDPFLLLHPACQISYLYAHATPLKERSFAARLKYQHRQFHYDVLAGMSTGTMYFTNVLSATRFCRTTINCKSVQLFLTMKNPFSGERCTLLASIHGQQK